MGSHRLAGAPISWGVCEVPGWGHQMAVERVLSEMRELGLHATELGPPGYLPADSMRLRGVLEASGLQLAAGFVAVPLHDRSLQASALEQVEASARTLAAAGADVLVLAAAAARPGYDTRDRLDEEGWRILSRSLTKCQRIAARHGLVVTLHPHFGTAVETADEVGRLLDETEIGLCLDTGHLFIGGADPVELAARAGSRVRHVHLKDVDAGLAASVRNGELAYSSAVRAGLYRPLGQGDLAIEAVCEQLEDASYGGWYVLEQDVMLDCEPETGTGPVEPRLPARAVEREATNQRTQRDRMGELRELR